MSTTLDRLVHTLRETQLLEPGQLAHLDTLAARAGPASMLLGQLVERGWLTHYQAARLAWGDTTALVVDDYVLLDRLGSGGMGEVYLAQHRLMRRRVALKLIRADYRLSNGALVRFHNEFEAAGRVRHPNVVFAHHAGQAACGSYFLIMEYIDGTDLEQWLQRHGCPSVAAACDYIRQAATGLQHILECGLVHRDIKPSNLLLDRHGVVRILDLGLASLRVAAIEPGGQPAAGITTEDTLLGTPDYVAPEQARDPRLADIRADIYSLGCTLYRLLAGRVPFPGESLTEKITQHDEQMPEPIRSLRPDVPPELDAIVARMMAKRPEHRYQTPAEVAAALVPFAQHTAAAGPVPARDLASPHAVTVVAVATEPGLVRSSPAASGFDTVALRDRPPPLPTAAETARPAPRWGFAGEAIVAFIVGLIALVIVLRS